MPDPTPQEPTNLNADVANQYIEEPTPELPVISDEAITLPQDALTSPAEESSPEQRLTIFGKAKEIAAMARDEIRGASLKSQMIIAALVGMTAYEFGPGNETVTPLIAGQFIGAAHGVGGIALTASVTGATVLVQQAASSYISRKAIAEVPKTTNHLYEQLTDGEDDAGYYGFDELSTSRQLLNAFFLGSSYNILRESIVNNEGDQDALKKIGRKSAILSSATAAVLGASVELINQTLPDNDIAQTGVHIAAHPGTWVAIASGLFVYDLIKSKRAPESPTSD